MKLKSLLDENENHSIIIESVDTELTSLFKKLVPSSGPAETVEGELVRAINRVWYRYLNDGDFFFKGYGKETTLPSVEYLKKSVLGDKLKPIFAFAKLNAPKGEYEKGLRAAAKVIVDYVKSKKGKYEPNTGDSR